MTAPIIKISQLGAASALSGAEAVPVVQGGVTKKATAAQLLPVPVEKFVFNTANVTAPAAGEMAWNADDGTVDIGLANGSVLQLGQETLLHVKATTALGNGVLCMATGADGNSGRIKAAPADGTGATPGIYVVGVATQAIGSGQIGFVTHFGVVRDINTTGAAVGESWAAGDVLYPHPTIAGALTKGAHALDIPVAMVLFASANGKLFVRR